MAEQTPSRGTVNDLSSIALDSDSLALIQRGIFKRNSFFGDISELAEFSDFVAAASTALNYSGNRNNDTVEERGETFLLTNAELKEINKLATYIASYGNVKFDAVKTFLIILCYIDDIDDMRKISKTLEVTELDDVNILRNPLEILAIRDLYKIAYLASALDALISIYAKYLPGAATTSSKKSTTDVLNNFASLVGGTISSAVMSRLEIPDATEALGHFMSELIDGKRIPTTIIAKNPMKQSPSYVGQTLFGESPNALGLVDITEDFPKKIAVFPKPTNGAGKSSFTMQNFMGSMNISNLVNQLVFDGGSIVSGTFKANSINAIVDTVKANTGILDNEFLDVKFADTGIAIQIELSAVLSNLSKSPFGSGIFQEGWQMACAVNNFMQKNNPNFLKVIKENTV